ncbi:hypothetical protein PPYR_02128 [Photinus pyralis]|uniref:Tyr recombinase domain-containing protein n=1 Tax=Photinus pyralis TaxID=7054 RepID=A0A5N4B6H0_PHOPY|nr:hypothetical protein PPYR_02128 [Photinus pyralis]
MKVVLIMGYCGACRREELTNMSVNGVEYKADSILISVPKTKNNVSRLFAVTDTKRGVSGIYHRAMTHGYH